MTTSRIKEMRELVKLAALNSYEWMSPAGDHPCAQQVDGQWYYPIWGEDTLDTVIDNIAGAICNQK